MVPGGNGKIGPTTQINPSEQTHVGLHGREEIKFTDYLTGIAKDGGGHKRRCHAPDPALGAEERPEARYIRNDVDRRLVLVKAEGAGRLDVVLVVEHDLRPPDGVIVEIMLPAQSQDRARIVAVQTRLNLHSPNEA